MRYIASALLILGCAHTPVENRAPERAMYIVTLGNDTTYIEWLTINGVSIDMKVVERIPRVRSIHLTATLHDDGTIASYKWEKISGPSQYSIVSPSKSRTLVRNLKEGIYEFELTVTDNAGAFAKDTVELAVISAPKSFARVFPNPATNVVNIQIEPTTKTTKAALRIYDNKGLLVFQEDFVRQQQGMIKQVSIIKLPSGIYFAELQTDINNIVTLRFMKK